MCPSLRDARRDASSVNPAQANQVVCCQYGMFLLLSRSLPENFLGTRSPFEARGMMFPSHLFSSRDIVSDSTSTMLPNAPGGTD